MSRRLMIVVRGRGAAQPWAEEVRGRIPDVLAATGGRAALTLTEGPPPLAAFPFRRGPVAVWTVTGELAPLQRALDGLGELSAYAVDTAWPVAYEQHWPDGEPTPTPMLLTLLRRRRGLSDADYLRRWHDGHTPLSLAIHPLWHYERSQIVEVLTDDSAPCDGIVLEACRTRAELLDPRRFYGGSLAMVPNMVRVGLDILGFLDVARIEVYLATEVVLRSG